jgi:predicted CxxxxCH...CXXCH cytochrome family protein
MATSKITRARLGFAALLALLGGALATPALAADMTSAQGAAHASHTRDNRAHATLSCAECHAPVCAPTGSKNVVFGALAGSRGAVPTYVPSTSSNPATCSNVYCHEKNAVPLRWTYTFSTTPPSLATECSMCHGYPPASHRPTTDCSACHGTTVLGDGTIDLAAGRHINGLVDFSGGGSGSSACNGCHGTTTTDGRPDYASGPSKANSHGLHPQSCNVCHAGTTVDGTTIANPALHMNGAYDLLAGPGVSFSYGFAAPGGTCSNISCHGGGSATWGPTTSHLATLGEGEVVVFAPGNAEHGGLTMTETCTLCHYENLKEQHAGRCEACHGGSNPPAAALIGGWNKGCSQCHAAIHAGVGDNHHETYWDSSASCELCHDTSSVFPNPADNCSRCHNPGFTAAAVGDHQPPTTTSNASSVYVGAGSIQLTAIDVGSSGVSRTWYSLDGHRWTMGNEVGFGAAAQTHSLSFYSVDHATNAEAVKTVTFTVQSADATPPTTSSSFNPAANASFKTAQAVTLTATDNVGGTGVKATYYKIDAGAFIQGSTFTVTGDGLHTFSYYSVDSANNTETAKVTNSFRIDTVAPVTTSSAASGGTYTGPQAFLLTASDTGGSGVASTWYKLDSGSFTSGTAVAVPAPASGSASHTISWYSLDVAGNQETTKSVTFNVQAPAPSDTTPPTTTSSFAPAGGANFKVNQAVALTATDNVGGSGVKATYYKVDAGAFVQGTSFNVTGDGLHTFSFYSVDNASNTETTHVSNSFRIDTVAPVTSSGIAAGTYLGSQTVNFLATDGGSGVASTWYQLDSGAFTPGSTAIVPAPASGSASHILSWYSLDVAGNQEATKSVTVTILAPVVTGGSTTLSFRTNASFGGWSYVTWEVHDAAGNVVNDVNGNPCSWWNDDPGHPASMWIDYVVPAGVAYTMYGAWGPMPDGPDEDAATRDVTAVEAAPGATVTWWWY